ncbi:MAG: diaminopimelate decarboxylase [Theionarchaea archaeon]|nr:diaminopimelate decarboxylase [Theionarchaea archaeon]MBU7000530.1 diaminopimelate decarboxylase [Theionarchaea archaeon]MBU7021573.1 diaminopimelate decarboxylase [Theionarchaea archaeon]MBU7034104.1 diaminopimelate decarboxylase [Theionarchaea archaeon]MBU7039943.1 diaminopimelate decarboxylase [Theionarchaea archaeon]
MDFDRLAEIRTAYGTPTYVYDKQVMARQYQNLAQSIRYTPLRIHYACKANTNCAILRIFRDLGCAVDCVSPGEIFLALKAGFSSSDILFTGNNLTHSEIMYAISHDVLMTADSLSQLEVYGQINPESDVCIRINPNLGAGHHKHVITGGLQSKFGIYQTDVAQITSLLNKYNLHLKGVHMHIGSGILEPVLLLKGVESLLQVAGEFPDLEFVDIGGGLGVPYEPGQVSMDLRKFGESLTDMVTRWAEHNHAVTLVLEPGRFLVAESGILLTTVTAVKENPKYTFVGVDTGFNHFMRPALYNAYHEIVKVVPSESRREFQEHSEVTVCGDICESADIFARNRLLPPLKEGDLLAILNTGAYGFSMASEYNSRPLPAEVLVDKTTVTEIRKRGTFQDLLRNQCEVDIDG